MKKPKEWGDNQRLCGQPHGHPRRRGPSRWRAALGGVTLLLLALLFVGIWYPNSVRRFTTSTSPEEPQGTPSKLEESAAALAIPRESTAKPGETEERPETASLRHGASGMDEVRNGQARKPSGGPSASVLKKSEKTVPQAVDATNAREVPPDDGEVRRPREEEEAGRAIPAFTGTFGLAPLSQPAPEGGHASAMAARDAPPFASGEQERRIERADRARWRVGRFGLIQKADQGGEWQTVPSGVEADLFDISFATQNVGWAVGAKGMVLRTTDGGNAWMQIPGPADGDLVRVRATSALAASVVTQDGRAFETSNGGMTWQQLRLE